MCTKTDYRAEALGDAVDMVREFEDQIIDQLVDDNKASDDLFNDYAGGDSYHHESHVDRSYQLLEAATILDDLYDFEETDNGLWEGLSPRDAISAQAAYTYGNAVYSMWRDLIDDINRAAEDVIADIDDEFDGPEFADDDDNDDWEERKESRKREEFARIIKEALDD